MTTASRPDASTGESTPAVQEVQRFNVPPLAVQWVLLAGVGSLVVAYLVFAINYHHLGLDVFGANILYQVFDMTGEVTIPTWYASSLLLVAALVLGVVAAISPKLEQPYHRHWAGLSVIFLGLSIDEAADVHGAVSYKLSDSYSLGGPLTYPWIIPGIAFTLLVALLYRRFLLDLRPETRRRFLLAGGLYIGGALAMEVVEATYDSRFEATAPYLVMVAIEESLEMAGVVVLIAALLAHAGSLGARIAVTIASDDEPVG